MAKVIFLFSFCLLSFSALFADDLKISEQNCTNKDIRDNMKPSLKEFFSTPREQYGRGWCYAFSTSDLLSAELGEPISSLHLAAIYNKKQYTDDDRGNDVLFEEAGGYPLKLINYVEEEGVVCKEQEVPFIEFEIGFPSTKDKKVSSYLISDLKEEVNSKLTILASEYCKKKFSFQGDISICLKKVEDLHQRTNMRKYEEARKLFKPVLQSNTYREAYADYQKAYQGIQESFYKNRDSGLGKRLRQLMDNIINIKVQVKELRKSKASAYSELNSTFESFFGVAKDFSPLVSLALTEGLNAYFSEIIANGCPNKLEVGKLNNKNYSLYFENGTEERRKKALETITKQLEKGKPTEVTYYFGEIFKNPELYAPSTLHSSLITAQRWNKEKNRCEFKVRKSWGKNCHYYKKSIDCIKEEGSFWLSDEDLGSALGTINYIE